MFSIVVLIALVASITNANPPSNITGRSPFPQGRIVGGHDVDIKDYPHQISLQVNGRHACGGSIISENYILTAGHCMIAAAKSMTVRAGSSLRGKGGSVHEVEKIMRHESYGTTWQGIPKNDISLLKLKTPIKLDATRKPIALFNAREEASAGTMSNVTGWGSTGKTTPIQLQAVSVPIVTRSLCNSAYATYGGIPKGQICASYYGKGGKDTCQGDSGGPLTIDGRLAGIVSWGNGCAKAYYPGVYTEVSFYRDWIKEKTGL